MKLLLPFLVFHFCFCTLLRTQNGGKDVQRLQMLESASLYGENYQSFAFDGGWASGDGQRSLRYVGRFDRIYAAWIDCYGDVIVGYYDNRTAEMSLYPVLDNFKKKTINCSLSLSVTDEGRLQLYFLEKLAGKETVIEVYSSLPENIESWQKSFCTIPFAVDKLESVFVNGLSYVCVSGERRVSFLKKQADAFMPVLDFRISGEAKLFKVMSQNGILYLFMNDDVFTFDGEALYTEQGRIVNFTDPISVSADACPHDIVIAGNRLVSVFHADAGLLVKEIRGGKVVYSNVKTDSIIGKVVIDAESPDILYFVREINGIGEIYKASKNKASKWKVEAVTENSPFNNRDIAAVANCPKEIPVQFLWVQESLKDVKINTLSSVKMSVMQPQVTDIYSPDAIKKMVRKVADWQLGRSYIDKRKNDWQWGAFYEGLIAAYKLTGDKRYWNEMMNLGQFFDWELLPDVLHADRLLICDLYTFLFEENGCRDWGMIRPTKWVMDLHANRKASVNPRFDKVDTKFEWWSWCDALFMAPASFFNYSRVTGDADPMEFAHNQWQIVQNYLYSKEDSLFYRDDRYFEKMTTHGKKVFWSRGNGWVLGSLPRLLQALPAGHEYRLHYETLFKEMAAKIKSLQMKEGLWTVSLLDPQELYIGESSGSGFFGFALAWGINNGLLDKDEYRDCVMKAWKGMCDNVSCFGRLGYVQQIAGAPYPFYYHQYHTYASGAFLLFAEEMNALLE